MSPSHPPPSWETLEDLAAGLLPAEEARALRERIAEDPELAARFAEVEALESALADEAMLPLPPGLVERVVADLPGRGRRLRLPALVRMAAAVLLAFGAWFASTGALPTVAAAEPAPALQNAFGPARELLPAALDTGAWSLAEVPVPSVDPGILAAVGLVLLVVGVFVARRLIRSSDASSSTSSSTREPSA